MTLYSNIHIRTILTHNEHGSDVSDESLWTKPDKSQENVHEKEAQK